MLPLTSLQDTRAVVQSSQSAQTARVTGIRRLLISLTILVSITIQSTPWNGATDLQLPALITSWILVLVPPQDTMEQMIQLHLIEQKDTSNTRLLEKILHMLVMATQMEPQSSCSSSLMMALRV